MKRPYVRNIRECEEAGCVAGSVAGCVAGCEAGCVAGCGAGSRRVAGCVARCVTRCVAGCVAGSRRVAVFVAGWAQGRDRAVLCFLKFAIFSLEVENFQFSKIVLVSGYLPPPGRPKLRSWNLRCLVDFEIHMFLEKY